MLILCIICSDLVNQAENLYVTKCGHIFHNHCLAQWIARSKTCPQCRTKVTDKCMIRLYPTISNETTLDNATTLQSILDDAHLQLRQQKILCKKLEDKLTTVRADLKKNELQKVLNSSCDEVEQMLLRYNDVKTLATIATTLKRALCDSESKLRETRDKIKRCEKTIIAEKQTNASLQATIGKFEDMLALAENKFKTILRKRKSSEMSKCNTANDSQARKVRILEGSNANRIELFNRHLGLGFP